MKVAIVTYIDKFAKQGTRKTTELMPVAEARATVKEIKEMDDPSHKAWYSIANMNPETAMLRLQEQRY